MDNTKESSLKVLIARQRQELFDWAKENLDDGQYIEVHLSTRSKEYGYMDRAVRYDPYYPSVVMRVQPEVVSNIPRGPFPGADNIAINLDRMSWRVFHPFRKGLRVDQYKDHYELIAPTDPVETIKFINDMPVIR